MAAPSTPAQVQALTALYRPPDPGNEEGHAGQGVTFEEAQTSGHRLHVDHTARLRRLVPLLALEARIALDVARDVHVTGGCEIEDGRRLALAVKRLEKIASILADAEREAIR